jgi:hypothetical protein
MQLIRPYVFQPLSSFPFLLFFSTLPYNLHLFFLFDGISDLNSGLDKVGSSPCRIDNVMPLMM